MAERPHEEPSNDETPEYRARREMQEDVRKAVLSIDPDQRIPDLIDGFKARVAQVEIGVVTEYNPRSYDNDSMFTDPQLKELYEALDEQYRNAVRALADLYKVEREIDKRFETLRSADINALEAAQRMVEDEGFSPGDIISPSDPS